ncbi:MULTISPECIES: class I adenylate-forming enzyme family protein [Bacillaceae]|uniref:Acyl--CoA ligase n=1 Tax=Evansella alkalicola TaxID=745819 RepID=A0ABS6JX51_9BACI|nr:MULTISPECIES: class I adenylate-forming enzyme family protein [Bacillaceae]MBU9723173.1 acyl--CoA ligase [Bacillus alkalicola]
MTNNVFDLSVWQLLKRAESLHPEKEVMYDLKRRMSYAELQQEAEWLAAGLYQSGVQKGDRIGVCLPNWHEFVVLYFALARIGAVLVPLNTRYRQHEVEHILNSSGVSMVFITNEFDKVSHDEQFRAVKEKVPTLKSIITVRYETDDLESYEQLMLLGKNKIIPNIDINIEHDLFCILFTSGTTGLPKGAMITHANAIRPPSILAEEMECTDQDVFFVAAPLFHVIGMGINVFSCIATCGRMVLTDVFKARKALEIIEQEKVTIHHGVPTMFILELNDPTFASRDVTSLRTGIVGGAPCPVEIVRRIREEMKCNICVGYGATETSSLTMTAFDDDDKVRSETLGKPIPHVEIKIVNDQREEIEGGSIGEIAVKGPGVMKGYYGMPEATKEVLDDKGWYYTGDIGRIDEKGYIYFEGRKKEMIIRGGYNIYPREVEELFYQHPEVLEVVVIGIPNDVLGELSVAVVTLKNKDSITDNELYEFVKPRIADYKVPDRIIFADDLPKTASGKITKYRIKEWVKQNQT